MLTGHEADVLYLELADDLLELGKPLPAHFRVVGGMGQVAGEDDEVGLLGQAVDGSHGLFERPLGVGIGWALEAPMGVGQLDEVEVIVSSALGRGHGAGGARDAKAGGEHHAAQACQFQKLSSIDRVLHG